MALTLIRIDNKNTAFKTFINTEENIQYLSIYNCDDSLNPIDSIKTQELLTDEKEAHVNLRKNAARDGVLITSHSTNPEWNPENYSKSLND